MVPLYNPRTSVKAKGVFEPFPPLESILCHAATNLGNQISTKAWTPLLEFWE